jgi:hypothetical protein
MAEAVVAYDRNGKPTALLSDDGLLVLECRPSVQAYAVAMEHALRKHDATRGPDGWKDATGEMMQDLMSHLEEEVDELKIAVQEGDYESVCEEAPHVGNMAMMILDVAHLIEANQ